MNNYRNLPELNDTKSGVLATNGQRQPNLNPSFSGKIETPSELLCGSDGVLRLWVQRRDLCRYNTVFPQIKFDKYFTHLVFWILHEMDMIEP